MKPFIAQGDITGPKNPAAVAHSAVAWCWGSVCMKQARLSLPLRPINHLHPETPQRPDALRKFRR